MRVLPEPVSRNATTCMLAGLASCARCQALGGIRTHLSRGAAHVAGPGFLEQLLLILSHIKMTLAVQTAQSLRLFLHDLPDSSLQYLQLQERQPPAHVSHVEAISHHINKLCCDVHSVPC